MTGVISQVAPQDCRKIALGADFVLLGGPKAASHTEHEHTEAQVTVHIPASGRGRPTPPVSRCWIVGPGEPHAGGWQEGTFSVVFHLTPELLESTADDLVGRRQVELASGKCSDGLILELAGAAAAEFQFGKNGRLFLDSIKHVLAGRLIQRHSCGRSELKPSGDRLSIRQLSRLREFIETRFDQTLTVSKLASAIGLSAQALNRKLNSTLGRSPHAFLTDLRIERAKWLLRDRGRSLSEIAFELGFASQSHFGATFRRALKTTPRRFRRDVFGF